MENISLYQHSVRILTGKDGQYVCSNNDARNAALKTRLIGDLCSKIMMHACLCSQISVIRIQRRGIGVAVGDSEGNERKRVTIGLGERISTLWGYWH